MPRKTTQKTAPSLTDPAEAALAEGTGSRSASKKKAASKKKTAAKKDATARDPDDPGAKAARAKKKAPSKKTEVKKARYTRTDALRDALAQGGTRAELAEKVDELYVQNGGESKPSGARAMVDLHCPVLVKFGVVEEDADKRLTLKR